MIFKDLFTVFTRCINSKGPVTPLEKLCNTQWFLKGEYQQKLKKLPEENSVLNSTMCLVSKGRKEHRMNKKEQNNPDQSTQAERGGSWGDDRIAISLVEVENWLIADDPVQAKIQEAFRTWCILRALGMLEVNSGLGVSWKKIKPSLPSRDFNLWHSLLLPVFSWELNSYLLFCHSDYLGSWSRFLFVGNYIF